ncbi:MAG TPA: hypothetical protein DEP23_01940 [Ruminococcaceae bacterium]|nr:hypothetical protein [Oscillospiraceae bacterium]
MKRYLSLALALVLVIACSSISVMASENAENITPDKSITYPDDGAVVIDAGTGDVVRFIPASEINASRSGGELTEPGNMPSTRQIIGTDDRFRVTTYTATPYRAIGRLQVWKGGPNYVNVSCAAFCDSAVITAAHCVYNSSNNTLVNKNNVYMQFGFDNYNWYRYDPNVKPTHYIIPSWYWNGNSAEDDWCIIMYDQSVTDWYFGFRSAVTLNSRIYNVTGYPQDKGKTPSDPNGGSQMWSAKGSITYADTYYLQHNMDTVGGNSGSAIYDDSNYIVGVHVGYPGGSNVNHGPRIDSYLYGIMREVKYGEYEY